MIRAAHCVALISCIGRRGDGCAERGETVPRTLALLRDSVFAHNHSAPPPSMATQEQSGPARLVERGGWIAPLLVGIVLRLLFVWKNEMDGGDWVSRTQTAVAFVRGNMSIWARTPWPEGNYLLPAIPLSLGGDPYWSVRAFCAAFSALAIPVLFVLGRQFGGRRGGLLAAWTLALLPFHIYISGNGPMTEGPFLLFVVAAIAAAIQWTEQPAKTQWLILSALGVAGAEAFRFDGVFVGASIGVLALFVKDDQDFVIKRPRILAAIAAFGVISLVYPIALVISWKAIWGDPLYMVKYAEENTTQFFESGGHQRWSRWFYTVYSLGFWPFAGPVFALTPLVWCASWLGVWRGRDRLRTWILILPLAVLTLFYLRAALSHTLLNQIRYVTALSVPLLGAFWLAFAGLAEKKRRVALGAVLASMVLFQVIPIDVAFHDRGVASRQLSTFALIRPRQHVAKDVVTWINGQASAEQKVVFTPHVNGAWLTLANSGSIAHIRRLNIYRTPNLVHDRAGLVAAMTDSLRSADWIVSSGGTNTEGLRDGLVTELMLPVRRGAGDGLAWNGIPMRLVQDFGAMRVYKVEHGADASVAAPSSTGGSDKR
ncbi:MAG: hypothetical protein JWM95_5222 [Gemmatimonadetes bacterium]|nr:hypothetical protein [Gemmatimonadota bacterium]